MSVADAPAAADVTAGPHERGNGRGPRGRNGGGSFVLAGGRLGDFERQLELVDQAPAALRALAEPVALEGLDLVTGADSCAWGLPRLIWV